MSHRHAPERSARGSAATADQSQAIEMIRCLRVAELQVFLPELGHSKVGRKADLQERAISSVRSMTAEQYQRLRQLYEARQGSGMSSSYAAPAAAPVSRPLVQTSGSRPETPGAGYQSMPTLHNFFSTPSSILSPKSSHSRYQEPGVSSWAPAPVMPPAVPQMEELSGMKFSPLPFYDELHCLIPPTNLNPNNHCSNLRTEVGRNLFQELSRTFTLTGDQAHSLSTNRKILPASTFDGYNAPPKVDFKTQLLLRFALSCPSSAVAIVEDCFPPALCLRVNGKLCTLPPALPAAKGSQKDGQRSARPVDITSLTKFSPVVANMISITWNQPSLSYNNSIMDYSKRFVFSVILVSKLSPEDLVAKIKSKGVKSADFTKSIIRDKLQDEDAEIATTSLRASLQCPLAKMRIRNPGRATSCTHIQCFDINFFLQMNEKKPTWICPVCDSRIKFTDLVIDGLFTEILAADRTLGKTEVQFDEVNGQIEWSPISKTENKKNGSVVGADCTPVKRKSEELSSPKKKKTCHEIITLDSDDEDTQSSTAPSASASSQDPDDDDDDDDDIAIIE